MSVQQRTHWGWHRLSDRWAERLVRRAGVEPGELVLDIGAGDGAITDQLVRAGARVLAIELHPARAAALREKYRNEHVTVVRVDATALRLPRQGFKVVANPPWAVTTAMLRLLLSSNSSMVRAELVVPSHVARRWSAGRGADFGRWANRFDAHMAGCVPSSEFRPAAPGEAAVLSISALRSSGRRPAPEARPRG